MMNSTLPSPLKTNRNPYFFLIIAAVLCFSNSTDAANEGNQDQHLSVHQIVTGDTLYDLAQQYLDDTAKWQEFLQYNDIKNPLRLQPGTELRIPPVTLPSVTVIFTHGDVALIEADGTASKPLAVGEQLQEGARINVGDNSYLSLQFDDGSIVRARSDSVLHIRRYRSNADKLKPASGASRTLALERGNLDISVTPRQPAQPARKTRPNHFEVITPMAVAAVRGTRFDVSASDTQTTSGVTAGSVVVRQNIPNPLSRKQETLNTGKGIRVDGDGRLGQVRELLSAPDLSALPHTFDHADYIALEWPGVDDTASYQVSVAADAEMQQVLTNIEANVPQTKLTGLADGHYVVSVRAVDSEGIIGYEAQHTFNLNATPAFPLYLAPQNKQVTGKTVTLQCTPVLDATTYRIQISSSADFSSTIADADQLEACSYSDTALEDGIYFWRAAAIAHSADGQWRQGPFSEPAQFEVDQFQNTHDTDPSTRVYWMSDRELSYTAQISRTAEFSDSITERALTGTGLSLENLPAGIHYIRLQAKDADGFTTTFSTPRRIEVRSTDSSIDRTWADKPR